MCSPPSLRPDPLANPFAEWRLKRAVKLQPAQIEKPLLKLRKLLKTISSSPAPDDVHALRTRTRRLEATLTALGINHKKKSRRLLKLLTPVRKTAGKVRDMDVLIGHALTLSEHPGKQAVVLLVEHLSKMRVKYARKLHEQVSRRRPDLRGCLKDEVKLIRKRLRASSPGLDGQAAPGILITELSHWPGLDQNNLHLFRIRIKELRYMLQLGANPDGHLVDELSAVKDGIGEWHDWVELLKIAEKTLDAKKDQELLKTIERIGNEKLQVARTIANRLRGRYFAASDGRKSSRKILLIAS